MQLVQAPACLLCGDSVGEPVCSNVEKYSYKDLFATFPTSRRKLPPNCGRVHEYSCSLLGSAGSSVPALDG